MQRFLSELMQTKDKFKVGATTLEVIRHPEKYISAKYSKRLSDLELEGLISHASGSGSFRFDAKWKIKNQEGKEIHIFVDTKNYGSSLQMSDEPYIGSQSIYIEELKQTGVIPAINGDGEYYFTLSKFDNSTEAISKLQLNGAMTDAFWRAEFEIDKIRSSVSFPYANWGGGKNIEVVTRSYPNYGEGGAIQFTTKSQIKLLRLVNIKTGEVITF